MSKTPFIIVVTGALLALHLHSARHAEPSADSRLVWTTRQDGKLEASLQIRGQNHARIVIWRCAGSGDGGFDAEQKIFEKSYTDATSLPRANPTIILQQPPDANAGRYRFEVFTSRTETTDWQPLSGSALMDYPAQEGRGAVLRFEDSPDPVKPGSDFRDITLTLREF